MPGARNYFVTCAGQLQVRLQLLCHHNRDQKPARKILWTFQPYRQVGSWLRLEFTCPVHRLGSTEMWDWNGTLGAPLFNHHQLGQGWILLPPGVDTKNLRSEAAAPEKRGIIPKIIPFLTYL